MNIKSHALSLLSWLKRRSDIIAFLVIAIAITLPSITALTSGNKINHNEDFYLYAGKHEAARKAILEYHTLPLRSFWLAGGYPSLGDPEDPALNPLILITLIFGTVTGLKIISFSAMLIGGLSTYALARYVLGYTKWGSLFSGLIYGLSLFLPLRIHDGNYNEVYAAFLPLCLLLIGLACQGRKIAVPILIFVFYTMLSDGKQTSLMAIFYMGVLCFLDVIPVFNTFGKKNLTSHPIDFANKLPEEQRAKKINIKPLKVIILALIATFFIGMMRFLPIIDLIGSHGGLWHPDIYIHTKIYENIYAYKFSYLIRDIIGLQGNIFSFVTTGWLPVLLSLIVFFKFRKASFPWAVNLLLFVLMMLAYNSPIDLFRILWNLPIFNTLSDFKYISYQIVFTLAIVSGQFFGLVEKIRSKWFKCIVAATLILVGVSSLYPKVDLIQKNTYLFDIPEELLIKQNEFYNIQGKDMGEVRKEPLNSLTYVNLIRGIGTIDINVAFLIDEKAVPKYFIDAAGDVIPNDKYKGEAYFLDSRNLAQVSFRPNSIMIQAEVNKPDTLIINQNYHQDWHTDHGKIYNQNGLLALQLDKTGHYNIKMRYFSRSFYLGLLISLLSLTAVIMACWSYRTGRLAKWSQNSSSILRWIPKSIIWLMD